MLDPPRAEAIAALAAALSEPSPLGALAEVASSNPQMLDVWAELGRVSRQAGDTIAAYAYFRVGYHRGLDALRAQGWRGSGYVRWEHPTNLGFLRCLKGLQDCASDIAEIDEAQRCAQFLAQLDPSGVPASE